MLYLRTVKKIGKENEPIKIALGLVLSVNLEEQ